MMDKYLKHLEKHSLLARRRNTTASKMLGEQLKHMEKKYFRGYRQYLREKSRTRLELRKIEDIASEFDDQTTPGYMFQNIERHGHVQKNKEKRSFNPDTQSGNHRQNPATEIQTKNSRLQNVLSSPRNRLLLLNKGHNISHSHSPESVEGGIDFDEKYKSSDQCHGIVNSDDNALSKRQQFGMTLGTSKTHTDSLRSSQVTELKSTGGISVGEKLQEGVISESLSKTDSKQAHFCSSPDSAMSSSHAPCRYSPQPHSRAICRHFPCAVSTTYHSIYNWRRDKNSKAEDAFDSKTEKLENIHRLENLHLNTTSITNETVNNVVQNNIAKNFDLMSKSSRDLHLRRNHLPPLKESSFIHESSESSLDNASSNSVKKIPAANSRARTTVRDKIRGLKQLVSEMRARNERNRPRAWAVNYGQHIPPRILLNPVMP